MAKSNAGDTKLATKLMPNIATAKVKAASSAKNPTVKFGQDLIWVQQHFAVDFVSR